MNRLEFYGSAVVIGLFLALYLTMFQATINIIDEQNQPQPQINGSVHCRDNIGNTVYNGKASDIKINSGLIQFNNSMTILNATCLIETEKEANVNAPSH